MSTTPVTVTNTEYTITDDEIPPSFKQGMVEIDLIARAEKAETQLAVLEADFEKLALSAAQAADRNVELRCRAEKAEAELAAANVEIENLIWNLAGCSTIAESGKPTDYSHELARPALHDVNKLATRAEKAEADTARIDWLEENMDYIGGGSGGTYTFFTPADVECGMLRDAIDAAMKEDSK